MNFTNINDPAGVSALLNQLRTSQAWADLQAQSCSVNQPSPVLQESSEKPPSISETSPSVASLLSQLSSATASSSARVPYEPSCTAIVSSSSPSLPPPVYSKRQNLRSLSFQQSLPHLARLSEDPAFLDVIAKLRRDQVNLERQLWKERQDVHARQAEKVKVALTKANMLGTGISEREANAMRQGFEMELQQFDRENVLAAWDEFVARQQADLESLGVPAIYVTSIGADRDRQQRVMQVLEGIMSIEGDQTS